MLTARLKHRYKCPSPHPEAMDAEANPSNLTVPTGLDMK